ncbi:MAG: cupin [Gammaproteobacteria bacterium HGW-Gammaproteobacteria-8]|nr:MAG: cupin [Gammaproteobacteria bacterium HGW-Gammaproteobacteria-8]
MNKLSIYADHSPHAPRFVSNDPDPIRGRLNQAGVRFEQWQAEREIGPEDSPEAILQAYSTDIGRLKREGGYQTVDVVNMWPEHPDREAARRKFLDEHSHAEDEVRFFVNGRGLFSLHIGDEVYEVLCERGDLIGVPAGTPHWFDMGAAPDFTAIRLFNNPEGWVARFTGSDIASRFKRLEQE